jgi:tyrosyl-tRNA synthetase
MPSSELVAGLGILALLVRAGLAASNGEAKRLIQGGGVSLHDARVDDPARMVTSADVVDGYVLVRAGKKRLFRYDVR